MVRKDASLLEFTNPVNGSNVLIMSVDVERFSSFEKLLELGANPNIVNAFTKYSVLIEAIRRSGSQFEWHKDNRYVELLLKYGADPNYAVEHDFTNKKGYQVKATSPLMKASSLDLDVVKILVKKGADPNKKIGDKRMTAFSKAVRRGKIDIVNFYIDSLGVDVNQPMSVVVRKPDNKKVTYYIQDYIVNKFTKAKLAGDNAEIERLKRGNKDIEQANKDLWELIKKLERMGVDFKDYDYKL